MSRATDPFWIDIDARLDRIEAEKPDTFVAVAEILGPADPFISSAAAFFGGSGGDRTLYSALYVAGWQMVWAEAEYHYVARHVDTRELLTYCEGDVYPGSRGIEL